MAFAIPAATSITSLFVIKTDFYAKKDSGEVVANIQALSPIPVGSGNALGFEVTEYRADSSVLALIDLSEGPVSLKFESQIRPVTDRFGRTTNTQVLTRLIEDAPVQRHQPNANKAQTVQPQSADSSKS